jgi:xanthine dehydrogenase accessory factor
MTSRPRLLILGVSPVAQALSELAPRVGFAVTVVFPGAEREFFPDADQVREGFDVASSGIGPADFVVVATQGRKDEEGLEAALATAAGAIAFVGSKLKAAKLKQYLLERGHARARVEAISSPAGLDIGAVTPSEIALSIVAGLVQQRREHGKTDIQKDAGRKIMAAVDPVCGMQVDPANAEYRSSYAGTDYYFCCAGCKHRFDQSPGQYLSPSRSAS